MQDERLVATTVGWFGVPLLPTMTRAGPPMQRPRAPHDKVYVEEITRYAGAGMESSIAWAKISRFNSVNPRTMDTVA